MQQRVAVVMGGEGPEREVARKAGEGISLALESLGHDVVRTPVGPDLVRRLRAAHVDAVFPVLEGATAREGRIQAVLNSLGLPFAGANGFATAVAAHLGHLRGLLRLHNLPLPQGYTVLHQRADAALASHGDLGFPCRVRPVTAGVGGGAMQVAAPEALVPAVRWAGQYAGEALVEREVEGAQVSVALLGEEVLGLGPTPAEGLRRQGMPRLSPTRRGNLEALARAVARALDCRGPLLVGFSVPSEDNEVIVSVDPAPRLVPRGAFVRLATGEGRSYAQLVGDILGAADRDVGHPDIPGLEPIQLPGFALAG
ncbi:MAG TPA: D-alanine--D-alanine ligase [Myxococcaceae bacterium]|nr:D-alanine--D-alanine ligase [Myxococcaceae bacterium]